MNDNNITKTLIDRYGLSFEQVAAEVGCTSQAVRNWYADGEQNALRVFRDNLARLYRRISKRAVSRAAR